LNTVDINGCRGYPAMDCVKFLTFFSFIKVFVIEEYHIIAVKI